MPKGNHGNKIPIVFTKLPSKIALNIGNIVNYTHFWTTFQKYSIRQLTNVYFSMNKPQKSMKASTEKHNIQSKTQHAFVEGMLKVPKIAVPCVCIEFRYYAIDWKCAIAMQTRKQFHMACSFMKGFTMVCFTKHYMKCVCKVCRMHWGARHLYFQKSRGWLVKQHTNHLLLTHWNLVWAMLWNSYMVWEEGIQHKPTVPIRW